MSVLLLVVATVAAVNPARVRSALPEGDPIRVGGLGAAITALALGPLVMAGQALLGQVDVAGSTIRMGVALVLVLQGGLALLAGPPAAEPAWPGLRAAVVPVAFPVTLTPGLGLLAIAGAVDQSGPLAWAVAAAALATIPLVALICPTLTAMRRRVLSGLGRATGAVLLMAGVALMVNGLFDV